MVLAFPKGSEPEPREPLLLCTNFRFSDSHNLRVRSIPSSPMRM
ncbi:hypothetical protein SSSM7_180 [Synechococcus phage S-SSM7]|uniref:Uncharacterized protein n=1 Tax=Synechococcus phage S-SSM7 TaxID=445686 RepID=E3SL98_9CAUD|nr:hypothetical protein SSSM7_180 [Synechococcus phage S-SSM7]ADO98246.1 hypothetical protein SSSM7_180 [Synechococcus phage S-SSM7]